MATIKITQLPPIGSNLAANTVLPVVNVAGTAATDKTTVGAIGNLILTNAGSANFAPAALANLAYSVVNAAQPNITSVGTLPINTLHIDGGTNGQYLQTDGTGNLAWVSGGGSGNGAVGGANSQLQFNNSGNFGGSSGLTWDASNNKLNTVNFAASTATIYGNVNAINLNASANIKPNAIYTDNYFYANGYVFGGGGGNGVPGGANTQVQFNDNGTFAGEGNFTYDSGNHILSVTRANVSYLTAYTSITGGNSVTANFFIGSGANLTNIAGANVGGFVPNANVANTAFAVAVANVVGIGNIATVALNGNGSQVLLGNGTWGNVASGSNTGNVTFDNINIIGTGNLHLQPDPANSGSYLDIFLSSGPDLHLVASAAANLILGKDNQANIMTSWNGNAYVQSWNLDTGTQGGVWTFGGDGDLTTPGNIIIDNGTDGNITSTGNVNVTSNNNTWMFGTDGNLTASGNLIIAGNTNVFGTDSALIQSTNDLPLIALSSGANGAIATSWVEDIGNIGTSNIAAVYANPIPGSKIIRIAVGENGGPGPNLWDFNANGTTIFPGDLIGSGASPAPSINNFNSISSITLSATGNITGGNIIGNGNTLSNVATQTTGNWTLAPGVNTVNLSVPISGTYSIWVNGNIPNGIVTYTATVVVTNTNVPVLGSSYGWYYAAGNALVLTAIPTQIVGTVNNISNAVVSTTTANVFTFGITNNSGSSQVVNWGYTKL